MATDIRSSAIEAQVAYVAPSERVVSAVEAQVAYSTRDLSFAGIEAQAYTVEPSQLQTTGLEVQAWFSIAQLASVIPPKVFTNLTFRPA